MVKSKKKFKVGDYIIYDNPHDYWDEGIIIDIGDGSYITIETIEGKKHTFCQSTDFKYLFIANYD